MQILVVYFAGHGVLGDQHELLAVGKDGETIDLNDSFLKAADEVDSQAGNSLVLLMDVCLDERYAADHKAAWDEERVPGYNINERKNSNLKVLTMSCLQCQVWHVQNMSLCCVTQGKYSPCCIASLFVGSRE